MDWFSKHTNWLCRETAELSNSSIYNEDYQFAEKTLISAGKIKVFKEEIEYYPVLIVYPEATPYAPPRVYILKDSLTEEIAREYSSLLPNEIGENVSGNARLLNRRHQGSDGSICFVENAGLHEDQTEIFSIKDILGRIQIWLSGKIPKDSREVDLFSHFPGKTLDIQYLIPDLFFNKEIVKGIFYAGLTRTIRANLLPDGIERKTCLWE